MAEVKLCSVEGCGKNKVKKGFCDNHYWRWRKHGDPLAGPTVRGTPVRWLKDRVNYSEDQCLIWPFYTTKSGYGSVSFNSKQMFAGRAMCFLAYGPPPTENHEAAHSCGNGAGGCVHPKHIRWTTPVENNSDKKKHGTLLRGETHPKTILTEENVKEIRFLGQGWMKQKEIAEKFGISRSSVEDIIHRKSWDWLS